MNYKREIALFFIFLTVLFVFLEIGLRIYAFLPYNDLKNFNINSSSEVGSSVLQFKDIVVLSDDEERFYELKKNLNVTFVNKTLVTNSDGFRDSEFSREKKNNTIRVVGIGDSTMFGWGVEENERYMDVLESKLKEKYPQYDWDFMVFAVPGYNLGQEVATLKSYLDYEPNLVIYGLDFNDLCSPSFIFMKKNIFSLDSYLFDFLDYIKYENSRFLLKYNIVTFPDRIVCGNDVEEGLKDFGSQESFENAIIEFSNISSENGFEVVVFETFSPAYFYYTNEDYEETRYFVRKKLPSSFWYLDSPLNSSSYYSLSNSDLHPNETGHGIMAEKLYLRIDEIITAWEMN